MKKVLIICDLFPPAFGPRMGYLCKYLPQYGWDPVVLTEKVEDEQAFGFLKGDTSVTYVNFYPEGRKTGKWKWMFTFLRDFFFGYKDKQMFREATKMLREQSFDLVLCSTFRTFPLRAACRVAQTYRLPLVVDLRDIIEQYTGAEYISHRLPFGGGLGKLFTSYFKAKNLRIRNQILREASCVTTISPWHVDILSNFNPLTKLIYNGFDPELFYPETLPTSRFIITYTGRLISTAMRDPSLLMQALSRLSEEGLLTPENCRVNWFVDEASWQIILEEAGKENVSSLMEFKGYVSATQIPQILNESSILLLLANKTGTDGPKGIMSTKLFESFAVEKPMLCVRSDESYLEETIRKANTGVSARTVQEAYDFILFHFNEWQKKGYTSVEVNREVIDSFSRKRQAEQFMRIFTQLIEQKDPTHG